LSPRDLGLIITLRVFLSPFGEKSSFFIVYVSDMQLTDKRAVRYR
jgi:hypothetical protein